MNPYIKNILTANVPVIQLNNSHLSFIKEQNVKDSKKNGEIKIFEINKNKRVVDKKSLLEELYVNGEFEGHFGFNWDALNDCLTEYDTLGLKAILFLYYHYRDIGRADFEIFLKIFSGASERYRAVDVVLKLILID